MRVDIHTHTFPAHKAAEVIQSLYQKTLAVCPVEPQGDGTLADLVGQEQVDGFDRFAVCPIAVRPAQYTYMVKYLTALRNGSCGEVAQRMVIPCISLHPEDVDLEAHLATLIELGAKMVKLHPFFQGVALNDPRMLRLLAICREAGLPVLCHTGHDISYGWANESSPAMVREVYQQLPDIKFICAHCAAWRNPETIELLLGRPIYVDLSFQPHGGTEALVKRFACEHPQDYVLFGSDWPWSRPRAHAQHIANWDLSPARLNAIMGENAARLLQLN